MQVVSRWLTRIAFFSTTRTQVVPALADEEHHSRGVFPCLAKPSVNLIVDFALVTDLEVVREASRCLP